MTTEKQKNTPSANQIVNAVLNIQNEANDWNDNAYKTAIDGLYVLLRKSYEQVLVLRASDVDVRTAFTKALKDKGYPFNSGTSIEAKVLRVVFNIADAKNKRIHRYANVLRVAFEDKIADSDFVKWLHNSNGIDNVVSVEQAKKRNEKQAEEQAKFNDFYNNVLHNVLPKDISTATHSEGDCTDFSVALVRHTADKKEIVGLSNSEVLTKSLLAKLQRELEKETKNANSDEKQSAVQQVKDNIRQQTKLAA